MRPDVLEEFAVAHRGFYSVGAEFGCEPDGWTFFRPGGHALDRSPEVQAQRLRRGARRVARAAARPPCPHCGAKVERCGRMAKIPTYCSPKCSRAARFGRWWAKNRDQRNAARRSA